MAQIISASIDLTKIDKSKINNHKNGSAYYNIDILIKDEKNQYGNDCAIIQSQSKEQREAKEKKVFIGNGKSVWDDNANSQSENKVDLPF
jgi:rare lipoprotein A (peptidoglycan hydrolase)